MRILVLQQFFKAEHLPLESIANNRPEQVTRRVAPTGDFAGLFRSRTTSLMKDIRPLPQ
jgi:hypothetical protein